MTIKFDGIAGVLATVLMLIGAPGGHAISGYRVMDHIKKTGIL